MKLLHKQVMKIVLQKEHGYQHLFVIQLLLLRSAKLRRNTQHVYIMYQYVQDLHVKIIPQPLLNNLKMNVYGMLVIIH